MRHLRLGVMPALGDEFRSAREARGLSLSDVAERLHIRSVYLAAIEDEDWKAIGAPVYVRGFMRTYARFLGLDAEDAVARFSASAGATVAPVSTGRVEERPKIRETAGERRSPSVVAILAILVAVGVVAYVGYAYLTQTKPAGVPVAAASPDADAPVAEASPGEAVAVAAAPPPALPVHKRGLSVHVTQTSWLRITIDGTVAVEGTFPPGTAKSFQGKEVDVRAGNAGGVELAVNGRPVGPLGASGDVVERHFSLSGE
jgi:cytoskeletal protein RodZ